MFLSGTTGVGKTTIYRTYASKYSRYVNSRRATIPILATAIPAPSTVKAVVSKLLWELGDPAYDKGLIGEIINLLVELSLYFPIQSSISTWIEKYVAMPEPDLGIAMILHNPDFQSMWFEPLPSHY